MKRKAVSRVMLSLFLTSMFTLAFNLRLANADGGTIYIESDGSVDPPDAPISTLDNVTYTFTADIYESIVVERDNIVVDGASYTVQGTGGGTGIDLSGRSNVTLKNTKVTKFDNGIWLDSSINSILSNNTASNNRNVGIYLASCNNSMLSRNTASNNTHGIWLDSSINSTLSGNTVPSNKDYGIGLDSSINSTLSGNTASNNQYGIGLLSSVNSTLFNNAAFSNHYAGIYLASCNNSMLSSNTVSLNDYYGIWLYFSINSTLFHNSFLNNTDQVSLSQSFNNNWDDGYPSGGNYWSDYEEKYPGAEELDGSGIWDTPYEIDENNEDRYPLMNPYVPDLSPPTTLHDYNGLWHNADFNITLTATDDLSGVAETYYKINVEPTKSVSADGQPTIVVEGANNALEYWSVDATGKAEAHHILTNIKLDKTSPSVSIDSPVNGSETRSSTAEVGWNGSDELSGVDRYEVSLDDGSWINMGTNRTETFTDLSEGTHTVVVKAIDRAGNAKTTSVHFIVNTSFIGGPGYTEEFALIVVVIAVLGIAIYIIKTRKGRKQ